MPGGRAAGHKKVGIHQPNYAPWCGYFAKIAASDVFVFLDDVQMPVGRSYVYRCPVASDGKQAWLSVPTHAPPGSPINTVRIADESWAGSHLSRLRQLYRRAPHFRETMALIEPIYQEPNEYLADFNIALIGAISGFLRLPARLERSSDLSVEGSGDDRLIALARQAMATTYISGPGGRRYQDPEKFEAAGVDLEVHEYRPVAYPQFGDGFLPGLTILDALFHVGPGASRLLDYPLAEP